MFSLSGGFTVQSDLLTYPPPVLECSGILAGDPGCVLVSSGWPTVLPGGLVSSGGDAGGVIAVDSCTGGGRCAQGFAASGLRCDLVRRNTPYAVLFLTMYDLGSFAAFRTSIRTG